MSRCITFWRLLTASVSVILLTNSAQPATADVGLKVATFDVDATPPNGTAMAYDIVKRQGELPLRCRGIVLLGAEQPIVLCAVDWIGIANAGQDAFRDALAKAAGTTRERVAVHTLHQHDAPGCDFSAEKIVDELDLKGYGRFQGDFHRLVIQRTAEAIQAALPQASSITHYGWGTAEVQKVASNRRIMGPDGKVRAVRYTATRSAALRAEPEGVIDPEVSLLSFWNNEKPVAILSYYACHPQSYYRTGVPSPDFPGIARFMRGQSVPDALHVHFNGAGGNIGAGKYNDGDKENRIVLANRLADGMKQAWDKTEKWPIAPEDISWQVEAVQLPPAEYIQEETYLKAIKEEAPRGYIARIDQLAWLRRCQDGHAIDVACLGVGRSRVLHMPGELFVEYQLLAKALRPDLDVAMAAYGEYGPGYIGTKAAYAEGGYETSQLASGVSPGAEAILNRAMEKLLGEQEELSGRILPKSPERALETFEVADGFEMQIVASEPQIQEPIVVSYDESGQMYVAEYLKFPSHHGKSDGPNGRIRLLTDKDADGRYETSRVFANGIAWPTGICPWKGGIFVVAAPDLWYFKDTDGDGDADVRTKIYTGFGFRNDEGTANNLKWGLDNWIYGAGSNSGGEIRPAGKSDAPAVSLRGRDFRFHPETLEFQTLSGSEQYGNALDDYGNRFLCSNSKPAVHVVLPARYLERNPYLSVQNVRTSIAKGTKVYRASPVEAWRAARSELRRAANSKIAGSMVEHDVFTGCSGITVYRGGVFQEQAGGDLFIGEVQSNIVHRRSVSPQGATFVSERVEHDTEFLRSTDNWFRPVNFANSPDGTLHVVDMYREFIETPDSMTDEVLAMVDFRSGHNLGRIYRIAPVGFNAPGPPDLGNADTKQLVASLKSPHGWWRDTASRLLLERRDSAAVELLLDLLNEESEVAKLHALHLLRSLDALPADVIAKSLSDPSSHVRRHAIQLAESELETTPALREQLPRMANDDDPAVRFQLALSLGEADGPEVATALAKIAFQDAADPWTQTAVLSAPPELATDLFRAELAICKTEKRKPNLSLLSQLAEVVGAHNDKEDIVGLLQLLSGMEGQSQVTASLLTSLGKGLVRANTSLQQYSKEFPAAATIVEQLIVNAQQTLADAGASDADKVAAIDVLQLGTWEQSKQPLMSLLNAQSSPGVQLAALKRLNRERSSEIPQLLVEAFSALSPSVRGEAVEMLLGRTEWISPLLKAVQAGEISVSYVSPVWRDRLKEHKSTAVKSMAVELFAGPETTRQKVIDAYRTALSLDADVARGEAVFKKNCMTCHQLGGIGKPVGPNLATVKNRSPESLLIHILDPNVEVQANYLQYIVELESGLTSTGQIVSESPTSVTLQRAEGVTETILRKDVFGIYSTNKSLMPEGLEKEIDQQQMRDLIEFVLQQPAEE